MEREPEACYKQGERHKRLDYRLMVWARLCVLQGVDVHDALMITVEGGKAGWGHSLTLEPGPSSGGQDPWAGSMVHNARA